MVKFPRKAYYEKHKDELMVKRQLWRERKREEKRELKEILGVESEQPEPEPEELEENEQEELEKTSEQEEQQEETSEVEEETSDYNEEELLEVYADCLRFRRMVKGEAIKDPFWMEQHFEECSECQQFYNEHKDDNDNRPIEGADFWGRGK